MLGGRPRINILEESMANVTVTGQEVASAKTFQIQRYEVLLNVIAFRGCNFVMICN